MAQAMDVGVKRRKIADAIYDGVAAGTHADQYLVYYALLVYVQAEEYERCVLLRDALKEKEHASIV